MEFYWKSKPAKLKKDTVTAPREMGGTGLINVQCKLWCLKCNRPANYTSKEGKWKNLFNYWICKASGDDNLGW